MKSFIKSHFFIVLLCAISTNLFAAPSDQASWSDVFKASKNQVVQIITHASMVDWFEPYRPGKEYAASGSGSFVSINNRLHILTNFHVIDGAQLILIQHPALGKEQFEVEFSGGSPDLDCALLSFVDGEQERLQELLGTATLSCFGFGDSDDLTEGQETMVIGYPLGQENVKNATGIISGRESTGVGEWITTTVPVNPGNSGGPFVNKDGSIIGICVARAAGDAQGIAYLIPINNARIMFDQFVDGAIIRAPFWGINFKPMTKATLSYLHVPETGGSYVAEVMEHSLGEKAGLKKGDIVTHINGYAIDRFCQVSVPWTEYRVSPIDVLMRVKRGDNVIFTVLRDGQAALCTITVSYELPFAVRMHYPPFDDMPDSEVFGGMVFSEMTMNHMQVLIQGIFDPFIIRFFDKRHCYESCVAITHIMPGSELDKISLFDSFRNRFVAKVNGCEIKTVADFRSAILEHAADEHVVIECLGGVLFALKIDDIIRREKIFARQKGYNLSDFYHELVKRRKG